MSCWRDTLYAVAWTVALVVLGIGLAAAHVFSALLIIGRTLSWSRPVCDPEPYEPYVLHRASEFGAALWERVIDLLRIMPTFGDMAEAGHVPCGRHRLMVTSVGQGLAATLAFLVWPLEVAADVLHELLGFEPWWIPSRYHQLQCYRSDMWAIAEMHPCLVFSLNP